MINGFVLDINNENRTEYEIDLFRDIDMPDGLSIKSIRDNFTFDSLLLMSKSKKFIGGGFQSDIIKKVKVNTREGILYFDSGIYSTDYKIIIDGL